MTRYLTMTRDSRVPDPDVDMHPHDCALSSPTNGTGVRLPLRIAKLVTFVVLAASASGCVIFASGMAVGAGAGAVAARDVGVKPGSAVKVSFASPRDVAALIGATGQDSAQLAAARYLIGRLILLKSDTVWMTLSEVESARGRVTYPRQPARTARVVLIPGARIEPLGNTIGYMVLGAALGGAVSVGTFYLMCLVENCFQ